MSDTWRTALLGDLVSVCRRGRAPEYEGGTTAVVGQKCVRNGIVDLGVARTTNEELKPLPDWAVLRDGDILVNSTGTGTVGRVGWLRHAAERTTADSHVTIVRPRAAEVEPAFLGYYLHAREEQIAYLAEGSTNQVELAPDTLKEMEVPLPPREEQRRIADLLEAVEGSVQAALERVSRGELLKESLLASLLTGDQRLTEGYDAVFDASSVSSR